MAEKKRKGLRSTKALRTPWFAVRDEACEPRAGSGVSPCQTLEFPDFVHVLAMVEDRVILVRQYRHGY